MISLFGCPFTRLKILFSITLFTMINSSMETIIPPHPNILEEMKVEDFLLVSGGPAAPFPRSKAAFQFPLPASFGEEATKIMQDIKHGLQYLFQTNNSYTIAALGTGNMGIEITFTNLVEAGDKVLIFPNGGWSIRTSDVISRQGGIPIVPQKPLGVAFTLQEIEQHIVAHHPKIVHIIMGESALGLFQDLKGVGTLCRRYGCLTTVDACHIMGIQPFFMDTWEIDAVFTNSQKGIGAPVGLAPVSFSSRAIEKAISRKTRVHSQINDVLYWREVNFWKVADPLRPAGVVHSPPISLLYTLREALTKLAHEGLEASWEKHLQVNTYFRAQLLKEFPFLKDFVETEGQRLTGEILVWLPPGSPNTTEVASYFNKKFKIEVATGMEPFKGRVLRFAFIGGNCELHLAERTLSAVKEVFQHFNITKVGNKDECRDKNETSPMGNFNYNIKAVT